MRVKGQSPPDGPALHAVARSRCRLPGAQLHHPPPELAVSSSQRYATSDGLAKRLAKRGSFGNRMGPWTAPGLRLSVSEARSTASFGARKRLRSVPGYQYMPLRRVWGIFAAPAMWISCGGRAEARSGERQAARGTARARLSAQTRLARIVRSACSRTRSSPWSRSGGSAQSFLRRPNCARQRRDGSTGPSSRCRISSGSILRSRERKQGGAPASQTRRAAPVACQRARGQRAGRHWSSCLDAVASQRRLPAGARCRRPEE
jgi:hypothetical protein